MYVLPVPALASSTVTPVGSGPQTSNGRTSVEARSLGRYLLAGEQPAHRRRASRPKRVVSVRPSRAALVGSRARRRAGRRTRRTPPNTSWCSSSASSRGKFQPDSQAFAAAVTGFSPALAARAYAADAWQRDRQRLAHPAVAEVDERPEVRERLGAVDAAATRAIVALAVSGAPDRARPTVTAENRRSGYAALSASSRTHAPSRWRALTREYVTLPSTSPRTPGTVPVSGRPSGSTTRTSTDSGAVSPPSARRAWPAISSTTGRMRSITGSASRPGGSVPRAISAAMDGVERGAVEDAVEQPSPDAPALEAVELDGQRVGDVLG